MSVELGDSVSVGESEGLNSDRKICHLLGNKFPKSEITYTLQVLLLYFVVISCIINLSINTDGKRDLWISLLASSLGYILPSPKIKKTRH